MSHIIEELGIYAKVGTDEKALVPVAMGVRNVVILEELNRQFGGSWVLCDRLRQTEFLTFTDSQVYKGFDRRDERYCNQIQKIGKP